MMLEGPSSSGLASGIGAVGVLSFVTKLLYAKRESPVVMRVINHIAVSRFVQQLGGAVVARCDYRQSARKRLEHDQRTWIVESRMDQKIGSEEAGADVALEAKQMHCSPNAQTPRHGLISCDP